MRTTLNRLAPLSLLPVNLEDLFRPPRVEGGRIEYKVGRNSSAIVRTLCAFANDYENLGGGCVVVGHEAIGPDPTSSPDRTSNPEPMSDQARRTDDASVPAMGLLPSAVAEPQPRIAVQAALGLADRTNFTASYLRPALDTGFRALTYPDTPRHRNQQFFMTASGRAWREANSE